MVALEIDVLLVGLRVLFINIFWIFPIAFGSLYVISIAFGGQGPPK